MLKYMIVSPLKTVVQDSVSQSDTNASQDDSMAETPQMIQQRQAREDLLKEIHKEWFDLQDLHRKACIPTHHICILRYFNIPSHDIPFFKSSADILRAHWCVYVLYLCKCVTGSIRR